MFEGDRTVCRLASSSCTTIGRDRRENKLIYCTKEKNKQRERKREREGEGRGGGRERD